MKNTIKTIAFLFLAAWFGNETFAQSIKYKNTSIKITSDAFSTISGDIRYEISSSLADADTLVKLFPDINFNFANGKLTYSSLVNYTAMWTTCNAVAIETTDVGKKVNAVIKTWTTNIIYDENLLNIDLKNWIISE